MGRDLLRKDCEVSQADPSSEKVVLKRHGMCMEDTRVLNRVLSPRENP